MSKITVVQTRSGQQIEVDTSQEAFKKLPQKYLRKYRSGNVVSTIAGIFTMIGVGTTTCCEFCNNYNYKSVIYGYIKNKSGVGYFYPPEKNAFELIKEVD